MKSIMGLEHMASLHTGTRVMPARSARVSDGVRRTGRSPEAEPTCGRIKVNLGDSPPPFDAHGEGHATSVPSSVTLQGTWL